ncbi:glycosylphosphatidylinositol-anchored merozoite surface protein [Babesia divergens]|uniref:Glycosylphosphatidylinositol-anchored merozoite surface protein n=1 Tax=Babesia divergens TaxID=32595 RepID=A0AAD9LDQ0_BABDI|nr:glycosylphosphatidylinositol-anchored merozoite surface protein [Babesia divergens]
MKTTKILNTAAICLLAMGFNGNNVSRAHLSGTQETAAANSGDSTTRNDAQQPGEVQQTPEQTPVKAVVKSLEDLREELKGQRETFLSKLIESDGAFGFLQLIDFLRVIDTDLLLKVDGTKVEKAGVKVKAYLESIGIKGESVEECLDNLMTKVSAITRGTVEGSAQSTDSEDLKTLLLKFSEDLKAEQERHGDKDESKELLKNLGVQRDELVKKFTEMSPSFLTSEDISGFLTVPEYGFPMDAAKWKKVEKKISDKLESSDITTDLKTLLAKLIEQREKMMDLLYGPIGHEDCPARSGQGSGPKKPSIAAVPSSLCAIVFGIIVSMF